MARSTSGTYSTLGIDSLTIDAFEKIQVFGPMLTDARYMQSARRSMILMLADISGNRNINQWTVGDEPMCIALQPGITGYTLPENVVDLLDCYLRTYTPSSSTVTVGANITPLLMNEKPAVTVGGDPIVFGAGSGTLSCVAGSQLVTMRWPGHGLSPGAPIFWQMPVSVGTLLLQNMSIVETVPDFDTVTFLAASVAPVTSAAAGATPLYATGAGVPLVGCILPNHGLVLGDNWVVHVATTVGGITIAPGTYEVEYVQSGYEFYFNPTSVPTLFQLSDDGQIITDDSGSPICVANGGATSSATAFENHGRIVVSSQQAGLDYTDIYLYPMSRSEYAMLPDKKIEERPTQFWFNRTITPSIVLWPVPPPATPNTTTGANQSAGGIGYYGFIAYRMRTIQDADPIAGQGLDMPARFYLAFVAELAAWLAEKFKPEQFEAKLALAGTLWERAAAADTERVSTYLVPAFGSYFR